MGAKSLGNDGPTHKFRDGESFEQLLLAGDEGVAGVRIDAVEEVGLFVVVGGEKDIVDYSLEDLCILDQSHGNLLEIFLTACSCSGFSSTDSVSRTCR